MQHASSDQALSGLASTEDFQSTIKEMIPDRHLHITHSNRLSKGERTNLSHDERNTLAVVTKQIVAEYRERVVKVSGAG